MVEDGEEKPFGVSIFVVCDWDFDCMRNFLYGFG